VELTGESNARDTIYRQLRDKYGSSRKKRTDAATKRVEMKKEAELQLKKLVAVQGMGTETALEVLKRNGYDVDVSVSTANRWLANENLGWDYRIKGKDLTPKRRFEAEGPNFVHQFDTTVSEQFYLKPDLSIGFNPLVYKNKPGKGPKLFLFCLIDDYSRATFARYYIAETTEELEDFLFLAWKRKDNPTEFPFCGLPKTFYTDNGPIEKSFGFKNVCEKFGIEKVHHIPGHPWAKGKVESGAIKRIQRYFESRLKEDPASNLIELNQKLYNFLVELNNRTHSQTGKVPFERWMEVERSNLILLDDREMLHHLFRKPTTRKITPRLEISIDNHPYALPWKKPFINMVGHEIDIFYSPKDYSSITVVVDGESFEVDEGQQSHQFGDYKGTPNTISKLAIAEVKDAKLDKLDMFSFEKSEKKKYFDISANATVMEHNIPEAMFGTPLEAKLYIMKEMGGKLWSEVPTSLKKMIESNELSKRAINDAIAFEMESKVDSKKVVNVDFRFNR